MKIPSIRILMAILFCALLTRFSSTSTSAADWSPGPGWTLAWGDEFSGSSVSSSNWAFDTGGGGWGNNELQTYTSSSANVYIQSGQLVIKAVKDAAGNYTSARLKTQGKRSWTYGKIAARIKLPYGQGIWPAFWMLGDNITSVGWPRCGEIDIMEMVGGGENRDDTMYGTLHWDASGHASYGSPPKELPDPQFFYQAFHVFEIEWNSNEIIWRLDGTEFFRTSVNTAQWPTMDEFHRPFFIILNLAVGGNWPGYPNASTVFPQYMNIDWVRVYTPSSGGIVSGNVYRLTPKIGASKSLDVQGVGTADGTQVQIWDFGGGNNQKWRITDVGNGFYKLVPQHATTKALDVNAAGTANGTKIQIWTDNSSNAQKWRLTDTGSGWYKLSPAHALGSCLDVAGAANVNGTKVQLYTDNGSDAQRWKLEPQ